MVVLLGSPCELRLFKLDLAGLGVNDSLGVA